MTDSKETKFVGIENLPKIEKAAQEANKTDSKGKEIKHRVSYSEVVGALKSALTGKGLEILTTQVATNQKYNILWVLYEVKYQGEYNHVLAVQIPYNSTSIKAKWGVHYKEEDTLAFPVIEVESNSSLLMGLGAVVNDYELWVEAIELTLLALEEKLVGTGDVWSNYMFPLAITHGILASSNIIPVMGEWDEQGGNTLLSFYLALCKKLSTKEPGVMFKAHDQMLRTGVFDMGLTSNGAHVSVPVAEEEEEGLAAGKTPDEEEEEELMISKYM